MKTCDNCKHYAKSMAQDPCRNCLPAKGYPSWEAAGKVEQTPAERIAELEAENRHLRANWQEEHTERIRLEERLKHANGVIETYEEQEAE